ncbi:MAG: hypothetical protein ACRD0X_07955, partial [Thermoanaerobaculia bacterium]
MKPSKTAPARRLAVWLAGGLWAAAASVGFGGGPPPLGEEFQVNTYTTNYQSNPSIAMEGGGGFVVVWSSNEQDGSGGGVFGRLFDAAGEPLGGEFQVNTHTAGSQFRPAVARNGAGDFVVVWTSSPQDGSDQGVFGQRYDAAGNAVGREFQINTYTTGQQYDHAVAADAFGNFVVVWNSRDQDGSDGGIFGQRYDAAGNAVGEEFQVNTYTTYSQRDPAVAADPAGNFVVVWGSSQACCYFGYAAIFAQRYDSAGTPAGGEFQVNETGGGQYDPAVAADAAGNFVVVWSSYYPDGGAADDI